ncbi:hypothetical protein PF005_g12045 [Phytophthora fragariae]|uniref:Secreted protein n=1 Tax=Phytophthora fragariae TaxID=53985 RepID=A0A6A4DED1_9STRA|nr:hypothetical protein PF003_g39678 [Phytophthora fragariae]KAE8936855.1 hypothetical protein PF009_g13222 [Phytophthora fragariae]KAE9007827.1 hypothetical protein PF011_g10957 [Phytophthora fragariae]KAE9101628.1 hypothetical protein PF010_g14391 [Phytophthora fragariae]KAE9107062.1 hypothetical protein PF007_g13175 [Phytophthora fragariae]
MWNSLFCLCGSPYLVLELLLCFYVGSMELDNLCMLFGAPPSTLSRSLRRAEDSFFKCSATTRQLGFRGRLPPAKPNWRS